MVVTPSTTHPSRTRCNLFRHVQPIHAGHLKVEYDDVELFFLEFRNRFQPIGSLIANFPIMLSFEQVS